MRIPVALLALSLSGPALAEGGVGFTLGSTVLPRFGPEWANPEAPGPTFCFGMLAWGRGGDFRIGGELSGCRGQPGVSHGQVGLHMGRMFDLGDSGLYLSPWGGFGVGGMTDRRYAPDAGPYRSFFVYGKPGLSFGRAFRHVAVEVATFVNLPLNLAQWVGTGEPRGYVTPSFGVQLGLTFGSYRRRYTVEDRPLAVPGPSTPPPPPPAEPSPSGDDRPLAIPADDPGPYGP